MLSENSSQNHDIPTGDQVARVYLGEKGGSIQYRKTRSRIDWMAGKMRGERALDIGCSQGILALLLGRGPTRILGIDIDANSIEYAQQQLCTESDEVKNRITFRHCDFSTEDIQEKDFDTVFIGEVVEHLREPKPFVARAVELLKEGARLVISTPHGFLPHHDHHHSFGLHDFLDLLPASISVIELIVVDGYIRMVGEKDSNHEVKRLSDADLVQLSTNSLIDQQKFFHDLLARKNSRIGRVELDLAELEKRVKVHESTNIALEDKLIEAQGQAEDLRVQLNAASSLIANERTKAKSEAKKMRTQIDRARSESKKIKTDLDATKNELKQTYSGRVYRAGTIMAVAYRKPWPNALLIIARLTKLALANPIRAKLLEKPEPEVTPAKKGPIYRSYVPLKTVHKPTMTVATIVDEFTESCFRYEWNLLMLTRKDWQRQIDDNKPALLFVESAWRGNGGEWKYLLSNYKDKEKGVNPVRDLVAYCKQKGIPCVFWNKEDPPNYEVFKYAAKDFDHIFTTDADCIPKYRGFCGHNQVYPLPFAAQPVLHNPAQRREDKLREVAFGGGWYGEKHMARQRYLPPLLDAAIALGMKLSIFDRFSEQEDAKHRFPETYQPYIRTKLSYDKMLSAYRMFPIFLNVNSATESPTMFSRRVFELLACGTAVVSSPSIGMQDMLGESVAIVTNEEEAKKKLKSLHENPERRHLQAHLGYRRVMKEHTYRQRAQTVVETVIPAATKLHSSPMVSVVLTTNRPQYLQHCKDSYHRQSYPNKELILALNSDDFSVEEVESLFDDVENVKIFSIPQGKTLAACLNHVIRYADGDYWAKFDDDDVYGPEYLADSMLPFSYTDADIVGKSVYFARIEGDEALYIREQGKEHDYVKRVCGGSLVVNMQVMRKVSFDESISTGADTAFLRASSEAGCKIYSADRFNFIQVRGSLVDQHTWKIKHEDYLKSCQKVADRYEDKLVLV